MRLKYKVLIATWVFLAPGLVMGLTGWMSGTFLHFACIVVGGPLAVWGLVLATKDLHGREDR